MFRAAIFVAILTVAVHAHWETNVLTYNTLLMPQYNSQGVQENITERREDIVHEIQNVDADVVCLQEVWISKDVEAIVSGLNGVYRYSYSLLHQEGDFPVIGNHNQTAACPQDTFGPFATCIAAQNCTLLTDTTALFTCVFSKCTAQYLALPQKCIGCAAFVGLKNMGALLSECTGEPAVGKVNINDPGLLLLSKNRMSSVSFVDYQPNVTQVFRRGYLTAYIDGLGDVTCTHLSAIVTPYVELHLQVANTFTNFKDQNMDEIDKLVRYVRETKRDQPHIILGDFNTGPAIADKNIAAEFADNYERLTARLHTALLEQCTFCTDNEYVNGTYPSMVIDHIFTMEHGGLEVSRVIDTSTVDPTKRTLSDHYGVLGKFFISPDVSSATDNIASLPLILVAWIVAYCVRSAA